MKIFWIILLTSIQALASNGMFVGGALAPSYGSGGGSELSSMLGLGVGISGGIKYKAIAFEIGAKRFQLDNEQIGNKDYDSKLINSMFWGGTRFILDDVFSLKLGFASHFVEMDLYKDGQKRDDEDGNYLGFLAGMGIVHPQSGYDFYYESTLYPMPEIDFYIVDIEVGIRYFL